MENCIARLIGMVCHATTKGDAEEKFPPCIRTDISYNESSVFKK